MYFNGALVDVERNAEGNIVMRGTDTVVQKGGLRIGQITQGTINEIEEIMVYWENTGKIPDKPLNPFGKSMNAYLGSFKKSSDAYNMLAKYRDLAKACMVEDGVRRQKNKFYTIYDLINEMERVQSQKMEENFLDEHGNLAIRHDASGNAILDAKGDPVTVKSMFENPFINVGGKKIDLLAAKEFLKDFSLARSQKILAVGVWGKVPDAVIDTATNKPTEITAPELLALMYTDPENQRGRRPGVEITKSIKDGEEGQFISINGVTYFYPKQRQGEENPIYQVASKEFKYSRDGKLVFTSKQTGFEFKLKAIEGLAPEILERYYGHKEDFDIMTRAKDGTISRVGVHGRRNYSTENGTMFDDINDELTKTYMGKKLNYQYGIKLMQIDKYRDFSKLHKEFWEGLRMLDDNVRTHYSGCLGLEHVCSGNGIYVLSRLVNV